MRMQNAVGADQEREPDNEAGGLHIQRLAEISLNGCLMVDSPTLKSLQIFVSEDERADRCMSYIVSV
jgi:hypothetical protein